MAARAKANKLPSSKKIASYDRALIKGDVKKTRNCETSVVRCRSAGYSELKEMTVCVTAEDVEAITTRDPRYLRPRSVDASDIAHMISIEDSGDVHSCVIFKRNVNNSCENKDLICRLATNMTFEITPSKDVNLVPISSESCSYKKQPFESYHSKAVSLPNPVRKDVRSAFKTCEINAANVGRATANNQSAFYHEVTAPFAVQVCDDEDSVGHVIDMEEERPPAEKQSPRVTEGVTRSTQGSRVQVTERLYKSSTDQEVSTSNASTSADSTELESKSNQGKTVLLLKCE